jgi:6-pyruvoyl-tetrahydropterin synthase
LRSWRRGRLDGLGVVADFEHLEEAVGEICRRFHYGDITSHPDFAGQSPPAEAVARCFFPTGSP